MLTLRIFGFGVGDIFFGHTGAYSANTSAGTRRGLIIVWLVQNAGFSGLERESSINGGGLLDRCYGSVFQF
jgi:hypothetical protein